MIATGVQAAAVDKLRGWELTNLQIRVHFLHHQHRSGRHETGQLPRRQSYSAKLKAL